MAMAPDSERIGISSWSVRHLLGGTYWGLDPARERPHTPQFGAGSLDLLDLPGAMAARGYTYLDLCHFHLPRADDAYLDALRGRLDAAGVRLLTLLMDEGDLSATDDAARSQTHAQLQGWVKIAARLGARYMRVAAGNAAVGVDDPAITRSADALATLARDAAQYGVGVLTENWKPLALPPANLLAILDRANATGVIVGVVADFGNCTGASKYDDLAAILPRATTVHAKAEFDAAGQMDDADFRRCLALAQDAGFAGVSVLIFSGPGDEWDGLARIRSALSYAAV